MLSNDPQDLEPNNGFKLIALKTLPDCDDQYIKVLTAGKLYYFYNNYTIDEKTEHISSTESLCSDIYNVNGTNVNISAIVGKNGCGKSALIEILLRIIHNLCANQKLPRKYIPLSDFHGALYYYQDGYKKLEIKGADVELYSYLPDGNLAEDPLKNQKISPFFYTMAVNYSHYAYNVNDYPEGNWLDPLFYKNDGYQAPIVLTPMRTNGNIEINNEKTLLRSRLLANLVLPARKGFTFRSITGNLEAYKINLKLKDSKYKRLLWIVDADKKKDKEYNTLRNIVNQREILMTKLNELYYFKYENFEEKYNIAIDYIYYKLVRISLQYPEYKGFFSMKTKQFDEGKIDKFLKKIVKDRSHITFKLRQTLNFLLFQNIELEDQSILLPDLEQKLKDMRGKYGKTILETIEMIPPPLFEIEVVMRSKVNPKKDIKLDSLSSGEKQMIYSVNSMLYHLININSVEEKDNKTKYKDVCIILEEIEMYFHPEMQRTYIKYILDCLDRIDLAEINSINFCFVTHSPFILSDIPNTNILFLTEDGLPVEREHTFNTFAANIHDILRQSFFLANGSMGELAKSKINDTIAYLNFCRIDKELADLRNQVDVKEDVIGAKIEEVANAKNKVIELAPQKHKDLISIIDEPILKQKLTQLYDEYHPTDLELQLIQEKIAELQHRAEKIQNRR
jgi:energy-coupling factor transporter ATP-binding protein EcfA2